MYIPPPHTHSVAHSLTHTLNIHLYTYVFHDAHLRACICMCVRVYMFMHMHPSIKVTVGMRHLRFWTVRGSELCATKPHYGSVAPPQTMLSVAFGGAHVTYTGSLQGDVYVWRAHRLQRVVTRAHSGPIFCMYNSASAIVSGGKDGKVMALSLSLSLSLSFSLSLSLSLSLYLYLFYIDGERESEIDI